MVISLVAGIAVPVITIGIPIYMGRKVLAGGPAVPRGPAPPLSLAAMASGLDRHPVLATAHSMSLCHP